MKSLINVKLFLLLSIHYLTHFFCIGQNLKNQPEKQAVAKSNTFQTKKDGASGLIYFSTDNGLNWRNVSNGLPANVKIGLGGITSSDKLLAIATKEKGVFVYNTINNLWVNLPTEKNIIDGNIGAIVHYKNVFYVGTQSKGVFISSDNGIVWKSLNIGLKNTTIRRFVVLQNNLYVCTNDGLYVLDEKTNNWSLEFGESGLQVNGVTKFKNAIYIATNKGIYCRNTDKIWKNILPNHSVHNISSDAEHLYGMTYTSLLMSSKDGINWQSMQNGLPKGLYTFNVLRHNKMLFAGQWDGIYKKNDISPKWELSSNGLPPNFAATNLQIFNTILVISTSESSNNSPK